MENKNFGFTLIELLGVIIILGILALITFPIIDNSIKKSKEQSLERIIDNIEEAAYNYSVENDLGYTTKYNSLSLQKLIDNGYLQKDVINPITNEKMQGCVLYRWNNLNNQYEFKYDEECIVPKSLISFLLDQYSEISTIGLVKDENNPNLYYYTGTKDEVANNFLWYGGHQWRILEFDTYDNTLTLITQQPLTSIIPSDDDWTTQETYNSSYINQWLNDYFWNSLDNSVKSNILNNTFNVGTSSNVEEIQTVQKVGLLDEGQYRRAGGTNSFLNIKDVFLLGSGNNSANVNEVTPMAIRPIQIPAPEGVRVVIKIYDIIINEGDGTLTNSYRLKNEEKNTSDVQVGEYINIPYNGNDNACGSDDMCTFRVVSKENEKIKVVLNGLLQETSEWADNASDNITTDDLIYTSILNGFVKNIDEKYITIGTYGVGKYEENDSYTVVQENKITANIGLPVIGEMFSGNDIDMSYPVDEEKIFVDVNTIENPTVSNYYWTMNSNNATTACYLDSDGRLNGFLLNVSINVYGVRPVIYLKTNLKFAEGEGTAQLPYVLQ